MTATTATPLGLGGFPTVTVPFAPVSIHLGDPWLPGGRVATGTLRTLRCGAHTALWRNVRLPVCLDVPTRFHQRQRAANCMLHGLNNMLQTPLLTNALVRHVLEPHVPDLDPAGWFHAGHIAEFLHTVCPSVLLTEGAPHLGASTAATWQRTLASQQHAHIDAALLILRPEQSQLFNPNATTHVVAACRLPTAAGRVWCLLDSLCPEHAYDLSHPDAARAFDADVLYFTSADSASHHALTRHGVLQHLHSALATPRTQLAAAFAAPERAWPGAPRRHWDEFHRQKAEFIVFAPVSVLAGRACEMQRTLFTDICRAAGLEWLACAHVRVCTRNDTCSILVTVSNQLHLQLLETHGEQALSSSRLHTNWRMFKAGRTNDAPAVNIPALPPVSDARTQNPFAPLQTAQHDSQATSSNIAAFPHRVGTLNTTGLHASTAPDKIVAIVELMHEHDVGILAVQETRLPVGAAPPLHTADYEYAGIDAQTHAVGAGFLWHAKLRERLQYLGAQSPHPYAAAWMHLRLRARQQPMYLASVYLPDASKPISLFREALAALREDILKFKDDGSVVLLGDFNARVGTATAEHAGFHRLCPAFGEATHNGRGRELLDLCSHARMRLLSSQQAPAQPVPTFVHRAQNGASSIVDHIIAHKDMLTDAHKAVTVPHADETIQPCQSDHTLVADQQTYIAQ